MKYWLLIIFKNMTNAISPDRSRRFILLILGIDLGINMGFAWGIGKSPDWKLAYKCKKTSTQTVGMSMENKIRSICTNHAIDTIGVEVLNFSTYTKATQAHGKYFESVLRVSMDLGIELVKIQPNEAKKALTGRGNACKHSMCHFASELYGKEILDDNVADAIGVYVATRNKIGGFRN